LTDTLDSLRKEAYNKLCDRCKRLADENIIGKWCQRCQAMIKEDKDFQKRLDAVIGKSLGIK
jgi:hypothetical protein